MLLEHFGTILWVTGIITMSPVLQFFAPKPVLALLYKIEISDEAGLFFARHWGLLAGAMGALLLCAAKMPELRTPVVAAALVEKAGIVAAIIAARRQPFSRGFRLVAAFDGTCVVLYAAWLAASL